MKKFKRLLPAAAVSVLLVILLIVGISSAYLWDMEYADNIVTIGKVALVLDEGSYVDSSIVAAGQTLPKAPSITNTGNVDEYVFLSVAVPKKTVTLLYEDTVTGQNGHRKGSKVYGDPREDEIFRMIAEGGNTAAIANNDNISKAFTYHAGTASVTGWISLDTLTEEKTIDGVKYNVYYFGYNRRLFAKDNEKTETLFDMIQLKSFIDEELTDENRENVPVNVKLDSYAIQADKLGIDGLPEGGRQLDERPLDEWLLSKQQLTEIFGIVMRKQATA